MQVISAAIIAPIVLAFAICVIKDYGSGLADFVRISIKRLAISLLSFTCVIFAATAFMLACCANISALCENLLSANALYTIKGLLRVFFGVDSLFAAVQMIALYSVLASFFTCLILSVGVIIPIIYRMALKATAATPVAEQAYEFSGEKKVSHCFKLYLKYNS